MKHLKIIIIITLITTLTNCSKKIYSPEELKKIAKTDSIKKEQLKMLESETIDDYQEIRDAHYNQN